MAVRWDGFAESSPELAEIGRERLSRRPSYLATIRADGSPRLHPLTALFRGPVLGLYMYPTSPKAHDLRRDPRFALHAAVDDNSGGGGEVAIRGVALDGAVGDLTGELEAHGLAQDDQYVRFEFLVASAMVVTHDAEGTNVERWSVDP